MSQAKRRDRTKIKIPIKEKIKQAKESKRIAKNDEKIIDSKNMILEANFSAL